MKQNNAGRASGLSLVLLLIVALLVAWLAVTQLGAIMCRPQDGGAVQPTEDLVQQAQDVVDALNERMSTHRQNCAKAILRLSSKLHCGILNNRSFVREIE